MCQCRRLVAQSLTLVCYCSFLCHLGLHKPSPGRNLRQAVFFKRIGESPVHWRLRRDKLWGPKRSLIPFIGRRLSSIPSSDEPAKSDPQKIDVAIVARDLKLPPEKVDATVALLDQGNTIPFITRFRKDLTGGLDEQQILAVKNRVSQLRALGERKEFVLKSIDSQGKLTDELKSEVGKASTSRRLEDLYLPFKPKKQSRALIARQQGLEPLAEEIFRGASPDVDLATRATEFVRVDKGLKTVDEVFKGVRDLL